MPVAVALRINRSAASYQCVCQELETHGSNDFSFSHLAYILAHVLLLWWQSPVRQYRGGCCSAGLARLPILLLRCLPWLHLCLAGSAFAADEWLLAAACCAPQMLKGVAAVHLLAGSGLCASIRGARPRPSAPNTPTWLPSE